MPVEAIYCMIPWRCLLRQFTAGSHEEACGGNFHKIMCSFPGQVGRDPCSDVEPVFLVTRSERHVTLFHLSGAPEMIILAKGTHHITNYAAGIPRQWAELGLEPQTVPPGRHPLTRTRRQRCIFFTSGGRWG